MVQVKINDGLLEGLVVEDKIAGKYYSFKGIPYAAPPMDELRFKAPQPVKPWKEVKSAKEFGSPSFQADPVTKQVFGSEDCLYLNVYTPEVTPKKPLPVMVWIHGGGLLWGSGNDDWYGPEFLVKQGVILVTINYRLGVLGFLCLDSEDVPGNAGVKDQVAALRWVQKNISNFGGDPDNVTIFGESAGGLSVTYHLVSPMSKGLFKRAISQSGTMANFWGKAFGHYEYALSLAKKLDFYSEDNKELYEFFKKQPIESFADVQIPFTLPQLAKFSLHALTVVDEKDYGSNERFFFGDPIEVLRNGIHEGVDVVSGYTEDEGLFFILHNPDLNVAYEKINRFRDYITPTIIAENCSLSQQLEAGRRVKKYYFGDKKVSSEDFDQFMKYLSMELLIYGIIQWAKIVSSNAKNNKVFLYKFGCKSERNIMASLFGLQELLGDKMVVCHTDDIPYLFPVKSSGKSVEKDTEGYKLIENAPQPVKPWKEVKSAKEFGSPSFQADPVTKQVFGSEDCLYLNVYTPEVTPKKPLPVMVWIHGGGLLWGSGNDDWYGPEFLVKQGVILVTINYRLGVLGFLCLDSEDVPGNAGVKDQVAALRWVQKNISNFGGDPDNVTIFGESAGGLSVTYHLVSPMSKGLFKRAISQSGTMANFWGKAFGHYEYALSLAKKLDFYSEDNKELYEFFKKQPIESFADVQIPFTLPQLAKFSLHALTVVDEKDYGSNERFFFGDPIEVLRNGIHEGVDVVSGYTEDEGLFFILHNPDLNVAYEKINRFRDYITPTIIAENCSLSQQLEAGRRVKKYYFGDKKVSSEDFDQFMKYLSMELLIYGIIQWAKIVSSNAKNNKVFLYKFGCKSERNIMASLFGLQELLGDKMVVCHTDDIPYLFPVKSSGKSVEKDTEGYKLIENVTKIWTNFAKYGHPTPDDSMLVKWVPYNCDSEKYLELSNQLRVRSYPDAEELKFWEGLFKECCPKFVH